MIFSTRSVTTILLLGLTACSNQPISSNTSSTSGFKLTRCDQNLVVKINNQTITDSAPNPFAGLVNPELRREGGEFKINLNTEEMGLFELSNFAIQDLQVGSFSGDKLKLALSYSANHNDCTSVQANQDAQLLITEYANNQVAGCVYGKFNCDQGKVVEVIAPFAGNLR